MLYGRVTRRHGDELMLFHCARLRVLTLQLSLLWLIDRYTGYACT